MHPLAIIGLVLLGIVLLFILAKLVGGWISLSLFEKTTKQMGNMLKDFEDDFFK
jgi:hypothetical protein